MVKKNKQKNKTKDRKVSQPAPQTRLGSALRTIGRVGGSALGGLVGLGAAGADTGHNIGAAISKWLGSGDYTVARNSIISGSNAIPDMHRTGQAIVVRHREYIADILAGTGTPTTFNVAASYPLNPGLATSFPWLSTVAQQFQEYTWRGLVYHFVSTSGQSVSSTNTSLGSVMMATNYRATAPAYLNKQQLLNEYFSCDSKPAESFCHPIECDPKENPYNIQYVRTSSVPSGEDQKTYDLGVMSVATVGVPAASVNIGELWATYEVELRKPIVVGSLQSDALCYIVNFTTSVGTTNPFGTARTEVQDTFGLTVSNNTITFPAQIYGYFYLTVQYENTTSMGTVAGVFTNCTVATGATLGFNYTTLTAVAATNGYITCGFYIPLNSSASTVQITIGTLAGASDGEICITQLPTATTTLTM